MIDGYIIHIPSLQLSWLWLLLVLMVLQASTVISTCNRPPIIFNFGDSNSDTGGLAAGLGYPIDSPNGRSFFREPSGRLSDGRLIIDFFCQTLNISFLSPYMESLGSNFRNGANFAVVGSSTLPKYLPFALNIQVMQFLHFKERSIKLAAAELPMFCKRSELQSGSGFTLQENFEMAISFCISVLFPTTISGVFMFVPLLVKDVSSANHAGSNDFIDKDGFQRALYMIDIGQNDLADSFSRNLSYAKVIKRIPLVIAEIKSAVKTLYDEGGRKFWIHNTGPLGCLPQKLWLVKNKDGNTDTVGCISSYNDAAKLFNAALLHLCQEMKSELEEANIVYVDMYAIKYDVIANAARYGFSSSPLMACCGFGGPPYNYNIQVTCGHRGSQPCNDGSKYVNWDGIHYTEAANAIVFSKILSTNYSTPRMALDFFCR